MNSWCKKWLLETIPEMGETFSAREIEDRLHSKKRKTDYIENTTSIGMFLSKQKHLTTIETTTGKNKYRRKKI